MPGCCGPAAASEQRKGCGPLGPGGPVHFSAPCVFAPPYHPPPHLQNNPFARPFEEVVDSLGIHLQHSSFDSSLYYIRKADAQSFLWELMAIVMRYKADANLRQAVAA